MCDFIIFDFLRLLRISLQKLFLTHRTVVFFSFVFSFRSTKQPRRIQPIRKPDSHLSFLTNWAFWLLACDWLVCRTQYWQFGSNRTHDGTIWHTSTFDLVHFINAKGPTDDGTFHMNKSYVRFVHYDFPIRLFIYSQLQSMLFLHSKEQNERGFGCSSCY